MIAVLGYSLISIRRHLQQSEVNTKEMNIHFVAVISQASVSMLVLLVGFLISPKLSVYVQLCVPLIQTGVVAVECYIFI